MAKYHSDEKGFVWVHEAEGDTPVIVLPEADWRELVEAVNACGGKGSGPVDRIHAIIKRTEAENGC